MLSLLKGLNCGVISIGMSNFKVYIPLTSQLIGIPFRMMPCMAADYLGLVIREQPCFHGHLVWFNTSIGTKMIYPISAATGSAGFLRITALCSDHFDLFSVKIPPHSSSNAASFGSSYFSCLALPIIPRVTISTKWLATWRKARPLPPRPQPPLPPLLGNYSWAGD